MSTLYKCRLCLKLVRNKIPIFKDDFPKMIEILTGLKVDPNDEFPKTSCIDCANNVKISLRTKKQIISSHKILLEEFLAKCKELDDNNAAILNSETNNTNGDNANNEGTIQSNFKKSNAECGGITELNDSSINVISIQPARRRSARTIVKSNSKSNLSLSSIDTNQKNLQDLDTLKPENTKQKGGNSEKTSESENCTINRDNIHEEFNIKSEENCDDLNGEPASPISDSICDVDWTPDKKEENKNNEEVVAPKKRYVKPIMEPSDGVFFVKKRNTLNSRKKKTTETVIRIRKKPKGRTPPTRVTCEICKKEVQSYWLQKHMETHEYNPVTCEFCGLISKSATALRHHNFYYHRSSADEYICDQCGRNFRSKYRLNLHKKKEHGGTKDFECTTCGKKFFERMHLKRHVDKTHKNIRPYVCDFCGKTFKSRNHIKIHERIHSKEAPYTCHMCGESFKMKLTLRTHLRGVHNVQEVQKVFCEVCKRGFASDVALKAHINSRVHETDKCQYCSEMFTREYMVNHLRNVHGVGAAANNI